MKQFEIGNSFANIFGSENIHEDWSGEHCITITDRYLKDIDIVVGEAVTTFDMDGTYLALKNIDIGGVIHRTNTLYITDISGGTTLRLELFDYR